LQIAKDASNASTAPESLEESKSTGAASGDQHRSSSGAPTSNELTPEVLQDEIDRMKIKEN